MMAFLIQLVALTLLVSTSVQANSCSITFPVIYTGFSSSGQPFNDVYNMSSLGTQGAFQVVLLRGPGVLKEALKTGISMKQLSGVAKRRSVTSYMVNQMLNHATFYRGKLRPNATKNYRNKLTSCKIKTKYCIATLASTHFHEIK